MRGFQDLFRGRDNAHGHYFSLAGKSRTDRGKIVSKAESLNEPVTPKLWKDHLAGKDRLGIIPVRGDGKTGWFCIDVDFYKIGKNTLEEVGGYTKLANAVRTLGLKITITRSKSGGAHLWCFLQEPIKASVAFHAAEKYLAKLNLPTLLGITEQEVKEHVDLFPKDFSPDNIGCWVNMPYFGDECYCIGEDGLGHLTLPEFVKMANEQLLHPDDLNFKVEEHAVIPRDPTSGRPPCIDFMTANKVGEGHRNDAVFQFGVFAMKAFPDTWEEEVRQWNEDVCEPPMRRDEVNPIIKSLEAKEYKGYFCDKIKTIHCDLALCKKRQFGVGRGPIDANEMGIEQMEKIDGEEPIYMITIGKKTFSVNLVDLYLYPNFRRRTLGAVNRLLPNMRQEAWEELLAVYMENLIITDPAADTEMRDRVIKQFMNWCGQGVRTTNIEDAISTNLPFYDEKQQAIIFSGDALLNQLDRQLKVTRDKAYIYMRGWGTVQYDATVKGKKMKLWKWMQTGPLWFDPHTGKKL